MARTRDAFGYADPSPRERQCRNCNAFHATKSGCHLFHELSRNYPRVFRLNSAVRPEAGCLAFERATGDYDEKLFAPSRSRIVDAVLKEGRAA